MRKILIALLLCLPAVAAIAEDEDDDVPMYEGVWTVHFPGHHSARFELRDWLGTWREAGASADLPAVCRGKKMPVTVQHSTNAQLEFTVFGSSVNPACPDISYVFKPVDKTTLEASLDAGKATMKRVRR